jgi:hypothetical protein
MAGTGVIDELVSVLGLEIKDDGLANFNADITASVGKLGAVVAGAFSAAKAISAFLGAVSDTAASSKFARNIDIGFESLQRLEFAAKQNGISVGALDAQLANLRQTARGALFTGSEGASEAFAAIGVSITDANGKLKDTRQLLLDVADAIVLAPNQQQALSFAERLGFGAEFETLLKSGSAGIIALEQEAQRLGLVIDPGQAAAAEQFRESLDALGQTLNSLLITEGQGLLNWLNDTAAAMLTFAKSPAFDDLKAQVRGIGTEIETVIALNKEFFSAFGIGVSDNGVRDLGLASIAGIAARTHPAIAVGVGLPLAIADFQKTLQGDDDTFFATAPAGLYNKFIEQPADFLAAISSGFLDSFGGIAGRIADPYQLGSPPGSGSGDAPINVTLNNENHFNGQAPAGDVVRALGDFDRDSILQAAEAMRSKVRK